MQDSRSERAEVCFISETATEDDKFGVHTRLSKAIQRALADNTHLRLIGLLGSWGSGKSTVVRILERDLRARGDRIFAYDAWIRQSDAHRRSFLEALLEFLEANGFPLTKDEKDRFATLIGKRQRSQTESNPEVSIATGLALALLLLMPLAAQFVRRDWQDMGLTVMKLGNQTFGLPFVLALGLAILPALIVLLLSITRATLLAVGRKDLVGSLVALFASKVSEVRTDTKTQDPEPTALEFKSFFRDVMTRYAKATGRRQTIVIDNIDRLPDDEMLSLWSSIRGLFHEDSLTGVDAGNSLPVVILPLDEAAIERLYKSAETAKGFTQKTFDLVFRVPTPVISQWRDYLERQIRAAFGEAVKEDWIRAATRLIDVKPGTSPTPREMNAFVNEVGALYLQWGSDGVSFAAMAYYVFNRIDIEGDVWGHLRRAPQWMADFDQDWMRGVAALRYGAAPATAAQILIAEPLRKAILENDEAAFSELSRQEGFEFVIEYLCEEDRAANSPAIKNAVQLMNALPKADRERLRLGWSALAIGLLAASEWKPTQAVDLEVVEALLTHCTPRARRMFIEGFSSRLESLQATDWPSGAPHIVAVVKAVQAHAAADGLPYVRSKLFHHTALIAVCRHADIEELNRLFLPVVAGGIMEAALIEAVGSGLADGALTAVTTRLTAWLPEFRWADVLGAISATQVHEPGATSGYLQLCRQAWILDPSVRDVVKSFLREFAPLTGPGPRSPADLGLLAVLKALSGAELQFGSSDFTARGDFEAVVAAAEEALGQLVPNEVPIATIRALAQWPDLDPLTQRLLRTRMDDLDPASSEFAAAFADIFRVVSSEADLEFWRRRAPRLDFEALAAKSPFDAAALLRDLRRGSPSAKELAWTARRLGQVLNHVPAERWWHEILSDGPLFGDLVFWTGHRRRGAIPGLIAALSAAIPDFVVGGQGAAAARWGQACQLLGEDERLALYAQFAARAVEGEPRQAVRAVLAVGDDMTPALLRPERVDAFFNRLVPQLLSRDPQWIGRHIDALEGAWRIVAPETRAALHRQLRSVQSHPTSDHRALAALLAARLPVNMGEVA